MCQTNICLREDALTQTSLVEFNSKSRAFSFTQIFRAFFEIGINLLDELLWNRFVAPSVAGLQRS